jgi:hypothetical protein
MCCANKTFLLNFVLWLITLLGLSPVAGEWAATFENWTGISASTSQATVVAYQDEGDIALYAHIFEPTDRKDETLSPAVITFHRTQSEKDVAYDLCRRIAKDGYMAITFEYPAFAPASTTDDYAAVSDAALQWLHENLGMLDVASSEIAVWATGYANCLPARLAVHAASLCEISVVDSRACPSALVLLFPPALSNREGAMGFAEMLWPPLWLEDIHYGISPVFLLLSDEAPSQYAQHAKSLLAKMKEIGISCESINYLGESWTSHSIHGRRNEIDAIAEMMHQTLQSRSFVQSNGMRYGEDE